MLRKGGGEKARSVRCMCDVCVAHGDRAAQQGNGLREDETHFPLNARVKQCATERNSRRVEGKGKRWCNHCHSAYKTEQALDLAPKAAQSLQQQKDLKRKQDYTKKKEKKNNEKKSGVAAEVHSATADRDTDEGSMIGASDMSGSKSDSEDDPHPKNKTHFWQGWSEVEATDHPELKPPPQPPPLPATHLQRATRGGSSTSRY